MANQKIINDNETELKIAVVIASEEYQKQYNNELSTIAKTAKFDGFRQGRCHLLLLKRNLMRGAIKRVLAT